MGAAGAERLLNLLSGVHVDVRAPEAVARSGGSFYVDGTRPTIAEWWRGGGSALIFDTCRGSSIHRALQDELSTVMPLALQCWSRSPIASLGRCVENVEEDADVVKTATAGLGFHRH